MTIYARDWIDYHASVNADKTAMIDLHSQRQFTYSQMNDRVAQVAGFLKSKGIEPGDRVAFLCLNTTDVMELVFGCWRIGAVCLALNFRLAPPEVAFILNDSEASMIVVDAPFAPVAEATKPLTDVAHWISTDGMGGDSSYEQGLKNATPIYDMHPQSVEDQCLLMYSSGTTGSPKGVIITHVMLEHVYASSARMGNFTPRNVSLNNMPLFHIGGLNVTALPTIWIGGTCVIMRMFEPGATLAAISDPALDINLIFMVPAAFNAMKEHPNMPTSDFSRLEVALCGAETVPESLMHFWLEKGIAIQEGYGMTETAAAGCMVAKVDIPEKIGSCGRPLMHSQVKIVDENGEVCPPNTPGEILFKGAAITPGYWRNPEANSKCFVDGWFRSGDIGRMDEDGYIYIEDRVKDMYISGGENIYPAEIEGLLYELPELLEVSVIGVPDEKFGEAGCIVAVFKADKSLTLEQFQAHLTGRIAKFKIPTYLHVIDALPRGGTGKVLKFELRKSVPEALGLKT
ncbi:AMP-binding protein [Litorimonas sp. RW-G-Af-16]|uniref:AMP-binding protein n=1 Tax=Litorimonas sp. RW-G-Af-16 TaxID=3241168 RepID=UPI00390CD3F1